MRLLQRYRLMGGTRYCPLRRGRNTILLFALLVLTTVGVSVVVDEIINHHFNTSLSLLRMHNKERALRAEAQVKELEAILNGQVQMVEKAGKYGRVATIKWETVEFVKEKGK